MATFKSEMPGMFSDKKHPLWVEAESRGAIKIGKYDGREFQYAIVASEEVARFESLSPDQNVAARAYYDTREKAAFGKAFAYQRGNINVFVLEDRVPQEFQELIAIGEFERVFQGDDRIAGAAKMYEEAEKRGEEFLKHFARWQMPIDRKNITSPSPDFLAHIRMMIKGHLPPVLDEIINEAYK